MNKCTVESGDRWDIQEYEGVYDVVDAIVAQLCWIGGSDGIYRENTILKKKVVCCTNR